MNQTIKTYNDHAEEYAAHFESFGKRKYNIAEAFSLVDTENPKVLELGCGNGRDGVLISEKTTRYLGIDASCGMVEVGKKMYPGCNLVAGDMLTFRYPKNLDIIFAFASLLHLDRDGVKKVFKKAEGALKPGGVMFISVGFGDYHSRERKDKHGIRTFYFYNLEDVKALLPSGLVVVTSRVRNRGGKKWLEVVLRKEKTR